MEPGQFICPFCDAPYTEEMLKAMDGLYGCDTGCEFMRVIIVCNTCHRAVYVWGTFGESEYTPWKYGEGTDDEDLRVAITRKWEEEDPEYPWRTG